jgi:hypothetical protein
VPVGGGGHNIATLLLHAVAVAVIGEAEAPIGVGQADRTVHAITNIIIQQSE